MFDLGEIAAILFLLWMHWDALTAIATCGLLILGVFTLIYVRVQIRDFRRENRVKHLIDLVTQFETEPYVTVRSRLGKARTSNNAFRSLDLRDPPPEIYDVMNFFEHMGFLLDGGYLDLEGVLVEFHYWILHIWTDAQELIKQEQTKDPIYYEFFAKMVHRLLEYKRPRTGMLRVRSKSDVEGFYLDEAELAPGTTVPQGRRTRRRRG